MGRKKRSAKARKPLEEYRLLAALERSRKMEKGWEKQEEISKHFGRRLNKM